MGPVEGFSHRGIGTYAHAMTDPDEPPHRAYHQPRPGQVTLREIDEEEDGTFAVRLPIASTGSVRNEGDEPLSRDELDGMARQINERDVGVFLAHGRSFEITDARYGQTERLGTWRDAEVESREGDHDDERDHEDISDLLYSTAVMADPESLPAATGRYREALAIIKEQAKRDIPLSASIGWREDADSPGGNDLMEASIVGIPADPRTVTQGAAVEAVARAAVESGADGERLVEAVRAAVTEPETDPNERMSDEDTEPGAESEASDTDPTDEETEREEDPEWVQTLLENQEQQTEILRTLADAIRQEDDDEDDEDDDDDDEENAEDDDKDGEEDDDDEDEEQSAEADEARQLREHLNALREGGIDVSDVDLPEPDPDETDTDRDAETGDADPNEDAAKALLR